MPTQSKKKNIVIALVVLFIIAAIGVLYTRHADDATASWKPYTNDEFGITVKAPPGWHLIDSLSPITPCCLFLLNYEESATTTYKNPGNMKIQIGYYIIPGFDPFKLGSTTKKTLGKNVVYTGTAASTPFYILPRTEKEGFGLSVISLPDSSAKASQIAEKILETAVVKSFDSMVGTTTATSTATTSATTTTR
ncbi:MAG: hypothetical protein JWO00_181 [Candidatus Parcubacteria bacterium]|nr:hypothetical protein [Candidatus Parcubacteria bacterium]